MSTPDQQLRIDRLTREALGNPDYEPVKLRTLVLTLASSLVALGVGASIALHDPARGEIAHRFISVAPAADAESGGVVDLGY